MAVRTGKNMIHCDSKQWSTQYLCLGSMGKRAFVNSVGPLFGALVNYPTFQKLSLIVCGQIDKYKKKRIQLLGDSRCKCVGCDNNWGMGAPSLSRLDRDHSSYL